MHPRYMKCLFCLQTYRINNYFLRRIQTSPVNNSKIPGFKIAEFSGHCFYMKPSIQRSFQICFSVPLREIDFQQGKIFMGGTRKENFMFCLKNSEAIWSRVLLETVSHDSVTMLCRLINVAFFSILM